MLVYVVCACIDNVSWEYGQSGGLEARGGRGILEMGGGSRGRRASQLEVELEAGVQGTFIDK